MKHIENVLKTTGIIKVSPADQLSTALGRLKSSHDAAFVFDDNDTFIGVINPYHAMIRSWSPGKTKVEHCIFHPPRITVSDSLDRIARLMMESKVHYLPVFDENDTFMGITSARRVLQIIQSSQEAQAAIGTLLQGKKSGLISVKLDDTLGMALELFKTHKFSKLIVVDANLKLKGVLSYYDLIPYLIAPGVSKKSGGRGRDTNKDKETFMNRKVKNYAKTTTLTVHEGILIADVIGQIISHKIGSVIVTDVESRPIGIVTTKDILMMLTRKEASKSIEIVKKHLSREYAKPLQEFTDYVQKYIDTYSEIMGTRVVYEEEKNGGLFRLKVELSLDGSTKKVFEGEDKNIAHLFTRLKKMMRVKK